MQRLKVNKAKCKRCGDIIESKTVHDFKTCSCGAISVDGGLDYLARSCISKDYIIELSEYYDDEVQEKSVI